MSGRAPVGPAVVPAGFFVLRTPLLPFGQVTAWGDGLRAARAPAEALAEALDRDRLVLRRRLAETVLGPEFRDALFVASPSLEAAVDVWRKEPDSDRGRAAERALVSYFVRAASRPTPFGLFAGCSTGRVDRRTGLRIDGLDSYRRHTRLDMDYLWALAAAVEGDPALRNGLVFRPNSSLYEVGARLLFAEARQGKGGRSYHLVAVDETPYLVATLERARPGARLEELATALVDEEITRADADEYLAELVGSQILVADVRPQLTGPPPTDSMITALAAGSPTAGLARRLGEVADELQALDRQGVGVPPRRYRDAAALLDDLPAAPELSRFVQVDLTKPADGLTLGDDVVAELLRGVDVLHAFTRLPEDDGLRRFRERFVRRYEEREIPLAHALDEENGIGFDGTAPPATDAALLAGLPLQRPVEAASTWTERDGFLLQRLATALSAGHDEIRLDAADVAAVRRAESPPLPDAFDVLAEVRAASDDALARGEFDVVLHSASGPPGVRLIGRFCQADDRLDALVREHLRAEESAAPDRVHAEVVHLPEGRVGNILSRPVLRAYEIPYLGRSGAAPDRQLELSDLLVSVRGDRVVLRSRRLGREVVPRLTAAHDQNRGLAVYRFLGALQRQGVTSGLFWDWGPLRSSPFLPRVVSGRVVLSRARWTFGGEELAGFGEPDPARRFAAVQRLRTRHRLPRYLALADGDNELVVDLDNVLSVEAVADLVRRRPIASFVEVTATDQLCAAGPEGRFTHQVVVPFARAADPAPAPRERAGSATGPRRFPPGSEWLYLKLFAGPATADRVLDLAGGVVDRALTSGAADRWFFLRYGDPDWHLRLRLRGRPEALLGEVLPQVHRALAPLLATGELWRLQLDTYEREVERYGGDPGIELAERVFRADSDAARSIIRALGGDAGAQTRWRIALLGIDRLFDDLALSLDERRLVARRARQGYGEEFGVAGPFQREVGRRFRGHRAAIEALLDPDQEPPAELAAGVHALRRRSQAVAPVARELHALAGTGRLGVPLPDLALSLGHMHVNRVLRTAHRAQELVLYEMLDRVYSSRAARRPS